MSEVWVQRWDVSVRPELKYWFLSASLSHKFFAEMQEFILCYKNSNDWLVTGMIETTDQRFIKI